MQQVAQIFDKLHRHGLVQAVLGFHGLGNFFRHTLGVGERATGNGVHQGEGDQNDHEHGNDHGSDALQDKFNHYVFPSFVCTAAAQGMAPRRLLCGHSVHMRCSWRRYRLTIQPPYNYLII